jgi:peptidyl-dipeptidase A
MHTKIFHRLVVCLTLFACAAGTRAFAEPARAADGGDKTFRDEVDKYLARYEASYRRLFTEWQSARWAVYTHLVPGDVESRTNLLAAEQLLRAFTGSVENVELSQAYLVRKKELLPLERRELERIAWIATGGSQIVADLVEKRIVGDAEMGETFHGFSYRVEDRNVDLREIDRILREESDLGLRRAAWDASKEVGSQLRAPLVRMRWLRNEIVRAMGQRDYFAWRVAEFGLGSADLLRHIDFVLRDLRPLQIELHTWLRYELAQRYGQPVPDLIPAHWLPSRFGEDASALVQPRGFDLDGALARLPGDPPRAVVELAQRTWTSLGFDPLPKTFFESSSLAPLPPEAAFKKSEQPSAWFIDLDKDVRALMTVGPDERSYRNAHRVLGAVYYDLASSNANVPYTLRGGASRAFHQAVGMLVGIAAEQPRFLKSAGIDAISEPDPMQLLLREALQYALLVPSYAGTLTHFESELYHDELPAEKWNARYWQLAALYQGIAPPSPRDERWCDAAADPDLVDHPGDAYERAFACVLAFELHDHIARKILYQDPHDTDYYGRRDIGNYLKSIMRFGASVDWRAKLREKTGYDLSAKAMVDYFEPLRRWLVEENKGRKATLAPL